MTQAILIFMGGTGLFLFGMEGMTAALRELAGGGMRRWLARFTTTPLRGVLTGLGATALIQSSTAVTLMTIGFVGAGVISFAQALGVLFGANIGTTLTGWIVVFLGFKLQLGTIALPVMLGAALMALLGGARVARAGRMLAGLALMFIGLDMMQDAATGLEGLITPERLPGDGLWGRLALVLIGVVLVTLMQSSTAGITLALVLLGTQAITFAQAAAMVIGMNVGTTFTGLLAAIGGARAVRMTALANLLFNIGTAALAFPLLGLVAPLLHATPLGGDDQTALVLFHSLFNILGTALFLPFTGAFARLVARLVPERQATLAAPLDPRLLRDEGAALDAALMVGDAVAVRQARALAAALAPEPDLRPLSALPPRTAPALEALEGWLARISIAPDNAPLLARYSAVLHRIDHLRRLQDRLEDHAALAAVADMPRLARPAYVLAVRATAQAPADAQSRLAGLVRARAKTERRAALRPPARGVAGLPEAMEKSDAARWLARVADHLASAARWRGRAQQAGLTPAPTAR